MKTKVFLCAIWLFAQTLEAQSIDIGNFYYRDYLDFGQNKGGFASGNATLTGKDGTTLNVPNVPNFQASSNYGSLTAVGLGFGVTANHVTNVITADGTRKFGLTDYSIADKNNTGISKPYGRDEKFIRFDKYIVEGRVDMLDIENSIPKNDTSKENQNLQNFKNTIKQLADDKGNVYIYQAGNGILDFRSTTNPQNGIGLPTDGSMKGGGFGTLNIESSAYWELVGGGDSKGIFFYYNPNVDFNNRITTGDSGSGIYAFDKAKQEWILVGVTSRATTGQNRAEVSAVSKKDLEDYQKQFRQSINLGGSNWILEKPSGANIQLKNNSNTNILQSNKDLILSGGGNIEVRNNIELNISGYAGGFVFESSNTKTKYTFTNQTGNNYFFKGSGLDIGENIEVEWHLRNNKDDTLHKVGKGTLIIKTNYEPKVGENLGYLKLGEGKVILDTNKKAFDGIYITSGRGSIELKNALALGATQNGNSFTLAQNKTTDMGFYFGAGGGVLDLSGNSLKLNTVVANDNKAIITNSSNSLVDFEIEGFKYDANNNKTTQKGDTIIHASFGKGNEAANLNIISDSSTKTSASLIFDGDINIKGSLKGTNSNIVLQGHPTAHATVSNQLIDKITNAENGTKKTMPSYMDLSKPSTLMQPDWDKRDFKFGNGIELKKSTLTIGKAANVIANISADKDSQINFGGKHFIDERDTKNVVGSGFGYYQLTNSGNLDNESYKDSSYSGKITASGATITSQFINFAPSLDLTNNASLNSSSLTLNNQNTIKLDNSNITTQNLTIKGISSLNSKITLTNSATFQVQKSLTFDASNFNLDSLQTMASLTMPTNYDLIAFNASAITAGQDFNNTNENANFSLDSSSFIAKNVSFKTANVFLQNKATFNAEKLDFAQKADIALDNESTLTLTNAMQGKNVNLNLNNKSRFSTNSNLNINGLEIVLSNTSSFNANKLTAQGNVKITGDENSTFTLDTLEINGGRANINAKADITNLHFSSVSEAYIGSNATLSKLNLTDSTASIDTNINNAVLTRSTVRLDALVSNATIDLKENSNLYLNTLNLNSNFTLQSDDSSIAHIKRLAFDLSNTVKQIPQSNLNISEAFTLKNVGQNLGTNTGDDILTKDLFAIEFNKGLDLNNANLEVSFADIVKKDNSDLKFDEFYTVFSASKLSSSNTNVDFSLINGDNFFAEGKFEKNAFLVKFRRDDPRSFENLNPHINNPRYSPLLEILLEHNKNDDSINKAANMGDYSALNARLEGINSSFENLANSNDGILKTIPLLQKQEINARIQQNRFIKARFAYNDATKSDFLPNFFENEPRNRLWSSMGASYFTQKDSKFTLQTMSLGYDRKFLDSELLLGVMTSFTQTQLSSDSLSFKPQIYSVALYSDALFEKGELQNELSFSMLSGDKSFEDSKSSYKSFHSFFETVYKFNFINKIKPLVLTRVNLSSINDFSTLTYKQKGSDDISLDLGLGVEWVVEKENGFYSATFIAQRDVFHTQKEVALSLTNASRFVTYRTNEQRFSYQLYLAGLENFKNGLFLRYALSAYIDSKTYKGVKGDIGLGYKF